MSSTATRVVTIIAAVVIGGIGLLVMWSKAQANRLIDEGNAAVEKGNTFINDANSRYSELFSEDNLNNYPGNRETYRSKAQEAADLYAKAAEQFRVTAGDFEKASDKGVEQVIADYWKLKAKALRKIAEAQEAKRDIVMLLLDEKVADIHELNEKLGPLVARFKQLDNEYKELDQQATKIEEDNKSKLNKK